MQPTSVSRSGTELLDCQRGGLVPPDIEPALTAAQRSHLHDTGLRPIPIFRRRPTRQRMRHEPIGEEHRRPAPITPISMLLDHLLPEFTRMIGQQPGMPGDKPQHPDIGPLPFTPLAHQINSLATPPNLGFLQRYALLHLFDITSAILHRQPLRLTPRPLIPPIYRRPQVHELRLGPPRRPRPPQPTRHSKTDLRPRNPTGQPPRHPHPLRIFRIRLELDAPIRHPRTIPRAPLRQVTPR